MVRRFTALFLLFWIGIPAIAQHSAARKNFNRSWKFYLGETATGVTATDFNDHNWRVLDLPHDWSIELPFDKDSPTGTGGGAMILLRGVLLVTNRMW
jgi:beta-galactosidase